MNQEARPFTVLMAEDDEDDRLMIREAIEEAGWDVDLRFAQDGEVLLDYLYREGPFENPLASPRPDVILLDLNMPRMDGREALGEIKSEPSLRQIPVIVLTTSEAEEDVVQTYGLGASSFIVKPSSFNDLVHIVRVLAEYWSKIVRLPQRK